VGDAIAARRAVDVTGPDDASVRHAGNALMRRGVGRGRARWVFVVGVTVAVGVVVLGPAGVVGLVVRSVIWHETWMVLRHALGHR
jgi:hypothetical protein